MFGLFTSKKEKTKQRLAAFRFPPSFLRRLKARTNWSFDLCESIIEEYRKFLYLTVYHSPTTPSKRVDAVWHLHMEEFPDSWQDMCKNTLRKDIQHHEAKTPEDDEKYKSQYQDTIISYQENFGIPSADSWGHSEAHSVESNFGGGDFGGSGAGGDFGSSDSGDSGGASCGSSCGGSCGGD